MDKMSIKKQFAFMETLCLCFCVVLSVSLLIAKEVAAETVRGTGSVMEFDIGYGILVNEGSSISREWVYVNDDRLPVKITKFDGLQVQLEDRSWYYKASYIIEIKPVVAFKVQFIHFNVWGDNDRLLAATEIRDYEVGYHEVESQWRILSENAAVEHFASLAYVTQVRLPSGKILRSDA